MERNTFPDDRKELVNRCKMRWQMLGIHGIDVRNSMFDVWNARIVVSRKMTDNRKATL